MKKSKYLATALGAVKAAEKIILHYFSHLPKVSVKKDGLPVRDTSSFLATNGTLHEQVLQRISYTAK
ncbi:MAG TPA: hypothetical protein VJL83_02875 [Patescibacteria group bacterium]|nr:hypothetical protein [Patescibacteria group bacterium]